MKLKKAIQYLSDPQYRFAVNEAHGWYDSWDDERYLKAKFRVRFGRELNLDAPQTFYEKLQWLKLYDRKPEYTTMVDKFAVKQYVESIIGKEYIVPTYGVWDSFDEIDFDALPNQFVLKCTHDSGGLVICTDKASLDKEAAKVKIEKSLRTNYYLHGREWPYKDVTPRIIAEKYLSDTQTGTPGIRGMIDYKFYCFHGKPEFLYVSCGMDDHTTAKISYVTLDWRKTEFQRSDYAQFTELPPKPEKLDEMIALSAKLSGNTNFLRCDFYEIGGQIYFSELTFYPNGGYNVFDSLQWDKKIGDMLHIDPAKGF